MQKLEIKLSTSPSHIILTPGRPAPVLTLERQAPGRVATGVPMFKSLVRLDPEKSRRQRDSNPGSSALEADALTTRPTRRSNKKDEPESYTHERPYCLLVGRRTCNIYKLRLMEGAGIFFDCLFIVVVVVVCLMFQPGTFNNTRQPVLELIPFHQGPVSWRPTTIK